MTKSARRRFSASGSCRASIRFSKSLEINAHAPDEVKHAIANQLNSEWNLARFYVPSQDILRVDYSLPYDTGLAPAQAPRLKVPLMGIPQPNKAALAWLSENPGAA